MHRFDEHAARIADLCFAYARDRLRLDPVPLDHPLPLAELEARAGHTITRTGRDPAAVLEIFAEVLAPACVSSDSPRFLAFIPEAPTKAAQLFDVVVSASAIVGASWLEASGAVYAENEALRWLADLAGLPAGAGGCFVAGGSAGNLSALVAAREAARNRRRRPGRLRVAIGDQAHSSLRTTLRIIDVEPLVLPTGADERVSGATLRAALDADPEPDAVFAVVATAGTTNAGVIDDLDGIGTVALERGLWFHVDGAYGLAGLVAPSARPRFEGIERADSLVVDPHKWLFAPFDCAALLYRDPAPARAAHAQVAPYLDPIRAHEEWNPADYAFHLTRRARGLPLWFSLAVHGTDAYAEAVERTLAIARHTAARIDAAPHVELVSEPELTVVLWRRPGWEPTDYATWSERLLASGTAFVTPTTWQGETVARAVFLHPDCSPTVIDELLDSMR